MTELGLQSSAWHVEEEIQPGRFGEVRAPQLWVLPAMGQGPVGWGAAAFPATVHRFNSTRNLLSHGCDGRVNRRQGEEGGRVAFEQVDAALLGARRYLINAVELRESSLLESGGGR